MDGSSSSKNQQWANKELPRSSSAQLSSAQAYAHSLLPSKAACTLLLIEAECLDPWEADDDGLVMSGSLGRLAVRKECPLCWIRYVCVPRVRRLPTTPRVVAKSQCEINTVLRLMLMLCDVMPDADDTPTRSPSGIYARHSDVMWCDVMR